MEFGLILYYKGLITHAGRDGPRWGALYRALRRTDEEVKTYVDNFLNRVNLTGCPEPFVSGAAGFQGTPLREKVSYPYQLCNPLPTHRVQTFSHPVRRNGDAFGVKPICEECRVGSG